MKDWKYLYSKFKNFHTAIERLNGSKNNSPRTQQNDSSFYWKSKWKWYIAKEIMVKRLVGEVTVTRDDDLVLISYQPNGLKWTNSSSRRTAVCISIPVSEDTLSSCRSCQECP